MQALSQEEASMISGGGTDYSTLNGFLAGSLVLGTALGYFMPTLHPSQDTPVSTLLNRGETLLFYVTLTTALALSYAWCCFSHFVKKDED